MSKKDAYIKKTEAKIDQVNAEIEKYKAKAAESGADAEIEYDESLKKLRDKRDSAVTKLDKLKAAGEDALGDIQQNLSNILDELDLTAKKP